VTDAGDLMIRAEDDLRADGRPDMRMSSSRWRDKERNGPAKTAKLKMGSQTSSPRVQLGS
jgi:hypothetical protein